MPPRREDGQPSMTLWIGNIPPDCTEEELRMAFSPHGYIENVKVFQTNNICVVIASQHHTTTFIVSPFSTLFFHSFPH